MEQSSIGVPRDSPREPLPNEPRTLSSSSTTHNGSLLPTAHSMQTVRAVNRGTVPASHVHSEVSVFEAVRHIDEFAEVT